MKFSLTRFSKIQVYISYKFLPISIIYSLGLRNRWQQVITGDLLLLPSNGHGREALVPRVYSAFKMAALSG